MEAIDPIGRNCADRTRHGLVHRVVVRRRELRTGDGLVGLEIPGPILARFEALDVSVPRVLPVRACMLARRGVAAADMPAGCAAAEVEPPAATGQAFDASAYRTEPHLG